MDTSHYRRLASMMRQSATAIDTLADEVDRISAAIPVLIHDMNGLSVRSRNILRSMGFSTIEEVSKCSSAEVLNFKRAGQSVVNEVRDALAARGLKFVDEQ